MKRFIVKVEGLVLEEVEEIELPRLPVEGEPIETRYGTALITKAELFDDPGRFDGSISCRVP